MSGREITIGVAVHSRDGKHLGDVDRLVLDGKTNRVVSLIIDRGIFSGGKLVETRLIDRTDERGVTLSIDADEAKELPPFVEREYVQLRDADVYPGGLGIVPVHASSDHWVLAGTAGGGLPQTGAGSFFMPAVTGEVVAESVTSVDQSDVMIGEGTNVVGVDGEKIGHVDEVLVDDDGAVTGIVVTSGHLRHHTYQVPMGWVAGVAHDHVRLNVTADQARQQQAGNS